MTKPYDIFQCAVPGTYRKGQDAVAGEFADGVSVIALSDGISSAPFAECGAQSAVKAATRFLTENFDKIMEEEDFLLRNLFYLFFRNYYIRVLHESLSKFPGAENYPVLRKFEDGKLRMIPQNLEQYGATILAGAVKGERLILMKIGNGVIAADTGNGYGVVSPSVLRDGVTTPGIERILDPMFDEFFFRRYLVEDLRSLILMSDGVEPPNSACLYDKEQKTLNQEFVPWFQNASRSQRNFEESVQELGLQGVDDVSVAALLKKGTDNKEVGVIAQNPLSNCALLTPFSQKKEEETAVISVSQSDEADSIRNEEGDAAERLSDSEHKTAPHKNGVPLKCRQLLLRITGIAFCLFCVLSVGLSSTMTFFLWREVSEAREDARQLKQVIEIIEKTSLAVRSENAFEADIGIAQLRECKNADSVRNAVALFEQLSHGETEMESDVVTSASMSLETGATVETGDS